MKRIVVVGAGVTGLSAAFFLQRQAHVTLLEGSPRLGGCLETWERDGFLLEGGPDCFLSEKPAGVRLCEELGLSTELINTDVRYRQSFIRRGDRLLPVPEGFYLLGPSKILPFLRTPLLSWRGKLRVLAEPFIPASDDVDPSLAHFVRRRLGREALERLAQPLLGGIYAADPEQLSLRATFPRFLEMERSGGIVRGLLRRKSSGVSGARYSLFVTPRRGMGSLIEALRRRLDAAQIRTNATVRALAPTSPSSWTVELADGERIVCDGVCLALPAVAAAELLRPLDQSIAERLASVPYAPSLTMNLAFDANQIQRLPKGVGFVTPATEQRLLTAATFVDRKFPGRVPDGKTLIRAFIGGSTTAELFKCSDERLTALALEELSPLFGIEGRPLFSVIARYRHALPHYLVGHVKRMSTVQERLMRFPGLALAGNYLSGVGIPDCIASAESTALRLL